MYFPKQTPTLSAAKNLFVDAGFDKDKSIFMRRVVEGISKLAELFDEQNYSVLCGRLVAALFSKIARGSPPTAEFLKEVWAEIEKVAEDFPYDEEDEKKRWLHQRYPTLHWAGDLVEHISRMVPPKQKNIQWKSKIEDVAIVTTLPHETETIKEQEKMCTNSKVIETIRDFCRDQESFTSLDISNKVKADGMVIRHREVAENVREAFVDGDMDVYGYVRDLIAVTIPSGLTSQAYLYHHTTVPADDYKHRDQVAIKPFSDPVPIAVDPVASLPPLPSPTYTIVSPAPRHICVLNTSSMVRAQKGDGRLEVPRSWMVQLGWSEGDLVLAVRDGNSLILKTSAQPNESVVRHFHVDRWNRIRITVKALNEVGIHFGCRGQHIMTLCTDSIKIN